MEMEEGDKKNMAFAFGNMGYMNSMSWHSD